MKRALVFPLTAFALLATPVSAGATDFIKFTDTDTSLATYVELGYAQGYLGAEEWTQTVATTNTTIAAAVFGGSTFDWWITDAIGPSATASDVIASGSAIASGTNGFDYNAAMINLVTGYSFSPGSYYLVMGNSNGDLNAEFAPPGDLFLHPGFSLGGTVESATGPGSYQSNFSDFTFTGYLPVLQINGQLGSAVPEPGTWAMMLLGFGAVGALSRRKRKGSYFHFA